MIKEVVSFLPCLSGETLTSLLDGLQELGVGKPQTYSVKKILMDLRVTIFQYCAMKILINYNKL